MPHPLSTLRREMAMKKVCRGLAGLKRCWGSSAGSHGDREAGRGLDTLCQQIKFSGPITVAEYMKQCLLNPVFGYYMQGDVFGAEGDFTTSPEVSQVFGELIAVWVLSDWLSHGKTMPLQLVELGPGRGSLLQDMMRVFQLENLRAIVDGLSLHLVEASPALAAIQEQRLQATPTSHTPDSPSGPSPYRSGVMESVGVPVSWYQQLRDVPRGHTYFIAHEFFDALPIHQFQMTSSGWREVLVDVDPAHNSELALRFVLSPSPTPASVAYTPPGQAEREGAWLEVCPQGLVLAQELAERLVGVGGGAALIADYGAGGDSAGTKHTLRAFSHHKVEEVLSQPGETDLTADVDFQALTRAASAKGAGTFGPISQNQFLHKLGIRERIEALMKGASPSSAKDLVSSYEMLTSPEHMGSRFQFLSITSSPKHAPLPFCDES